MLSEKMPKIKLVFGNMQVAKIFIISIKLQKLFDGRTAVLVTLEFLIELTEFKIQDRVSVTD